MKKGIILSLVFCVLVSITGYAKPKQWTTQFAYRYYECYPNSGVKSFQSTTYDAKWKQLQTRGFTFDVEGNLTREYVLNGADTTDIATYKYKNNRLVEIITNDGAKGKTKYDSEGFLTSIQFYNDWQGKKTLWSSHEMTYNNDGLLTLYIIKKEPVGYQPESDVEDNGGYKEIRIDYTDGLRSYYVMLESNYNENRHLRYEYDYNQYGFAKGVSIYDNASGKSLQTLTYTYKYDEHNNWIERTQKEKGKLQQTEKRVLTYYTPEEIAAAAKPSVKEQKTSTGDGFFATIGGYLSGLKERLELQSMLYDGGAVLLVFLLLMTIAGMIIALVRMIKRPPFKRHKQANGMQRLWMYDSSPYLNVLTYFGIALGCFIASILIIALVGGVLWLLAWILKILVWIIIVLGWILAIGGGLAAWGGEYLYGIIAAIIGIVILTNKDTLKGWGESAVDWSFDFLQRVNMIGWGFNFVVNLWDGILLVFLTPIALFLIVAVIIILLNSLLNGLEWIVTRIYSIRRPCPSCGSTKTPDYLVLGKVHPVKLHPGTYGVFTQVSPVNNKRIPTMLLNGKGKLDRKCPDCGTIIHADAQKTYGTDIHIGFVGHRSSGKSYLLYSGLSALTKAHSGKIQQIDADQDTRIEGKKQRIDARQGIQTNVANRYRAVQLMISSRMRPVPYHLFFYDVAGEKFNASSSSYKTAMDFYKNVESIVFVIDPSMIDYTGIPASEQVKNWAHKPGISMGETYRVDNSFSVLKDILESVGRKSKKIDFSFVCTKSDMGYFEAEGINRKGITEQAIENFMRTGLGLGNLVNSAKASFNNVHFFEISVTEGNTTKLNQLFDFLLKQRGVSI